MDESRAEYLLRNYPVLVRQLAGRRDDLLHRGRQGGYVEIGRGYDPGDPTAKRGIQLVEISLIEKELDITRKLIDSLKRNAERQVLIATWRAKTDEPDFDLVSKFLGGDWTSQEVAEVWSRMCERLARTLN